MMKLLILAQSYPSENPQDMAGIFIHRQLVALQRKGWDIRVIAPQPFLYRELKGLGSFYPLHSVRDGIRIWRPRGLWIPKLMSPNAGIRLEKNYAAAVEHAFLPLAKSWEPDLIVGDWIVPFGFAAAEVARKLHVSYLLRARGHDVLIVTEASKKPALRDHYRALLGNAILVLCQGKGIYDDLLISGLITAERLLVVSNGVNTDVFHPLDAGGRHHLRDKLRLPREAQVWLFVGTWTAAKGTAEMAQVIPDLLVRYPHSYFVAAGPIKDNKTSDLLRAASPRVRFVGMVDTATVAQWMQIADIFLLPTYREGLPNALLEAMACGLVCIATPVNGIPYVLRDGVNGINVEPRNAASLRDALERCTKGLDALRPLGEAAMRTVREEGYSLDTAVECIHRVFLRCAAGSE